jgi:hypothetical protein
LSAVEALQRYVKRLLQWLIALALLFEEWGWEPLQRALARLARWPPIGALERHIGRLPPYAALALFIVPSLMLLPIKLLALWLIGRGHALAGLLVIVVAKVAGTAVVARLFFLTQPALMQVPWFARLYARWSAWKGGLMALARGSWPWRVSRVIQRAVRRRLARWRGG